MTPKSPITERELEFYGSAIREGMEFKRDTARRILALPPNDRRLFLSLMDYEDRRMLRRWRVITESDIRNTQRQILGAVPGGTK